LSSAEALVLGPSGVVRQRELYESLLATVAHSPDSKRVADGWAELARWQQSAGRYHDAALCWLMAVWESSEKSSLLQWQQNWWQLELRLAQVSEEILQRPQFWRQYGGRVGAVRLAAACLVRWVEPPHRVSQAVRQLVPELLAVLERHAEGAPLRACWLAVQAVSRWCGGDPLLLARWADRLLQRLAEQGYALDLDLPSILRFAGTGETEYYAAVSSWFTRLRQPVIEWVHTHPTGPLRWEGLHGERQTTAQVAQLLLGWGLAAVGQRRRALNWVEAIPHDPSDLEEDILAALQVVVQLARSRILDASDGHPADPWPPPPWWQQRRQLSPAARYAVDRLCESCRILDPFLLMRPLRSWELAPVHAQDALGERLVLLWDVTDAAHLREEAAQLLKECAAASNHADICRVVIALAEIAALLPSTQLHQLLCWLPLVWQKLPLYWPETPTEPAFGVTHLRSYEVCCRLFENIIRALSVWPAETASACLSGLWQQWRQCGISWTQTTPAVVRSLAEAFRRLHLHAELEQLAESCRQAGWLEPEASWPNRLTAAAAFLALDSDGHYDDILDAARDRLFLPSDHTSTPAPRTYTHLALAYAAALAFLPSRRRLGRFEELFQRLRPLHVQGSTNRFWTLQPLRLIDIVVRSVVGEIQPLSPMVQQWLTREDMRFRQRLYADIAQALGDNVLPNGDPST
jgi:hypothetical protein